MSPALVSSQLTREKYGYASGLMDAEYLRQDIERLETALQNSHLEADVALRLSHACEREARGLHASASQVQGTVTRVLIQRARILLSSKLPEPALAALKQAESEFGDLPYDQLKVRIFAARAEAYAALKQWHEASKTCEEGIELVEQTRYKVSGEYLQSGYMTSRLRLYSVGVEAAYRIKQYELMVQRAELSKCRSVLKRGGCPKSATRDAGEIEQQFRDICEQIDAARVEDCDYQVVAPLLSKRSLLWDLLLIERGQERLPEFNLDILCAVLERDEAVLYYYWVDRRKLLIVYIEKADSVAKLVLLSEGERQAMEEFCCTILAGMEEGHLNAMDELKPLLLPDSIARRLRRKKRILILESEVNADRDRANL